MSHLIRIATKADAAAMVEMLNHYILDSTATFQTEPQTLEDRLAWFDDRDEMHPVVSVDVEGKVIAWGTLSVFNPRQGYRKTAEVSVYVHLEFQRRGIGRAIVIDLIARARDLGYHALLAICCSESTGSIALHESLGFERVGHLREVGWKFERWLDVVYLQLLL
jgi:L-amino acid N-acyltransferase